MRQHLGDEAGRALEPAGDVLRGGEEPRRLAERDAVELLHASSHRAILGRLAELPEVGAVELVGLPELVHEPDALLRVPDRVGGELGRHDHVDRASVGLRQVEQPPEERLRQHARAGIPLERDGDDLRLVPAGAQLVDEGIAEDLRPTVREGNLRPADGDPHGSEAAFRATRLAPW